MDQNRQFDDAVYGLNYAKESLDPARSEMFWEIEAALLIRVGFGITISSRLWMF